MKKITIGIITILTIIFSAMNSFAVSEPTIEVSSETLMLADNTETNPTVEVEISLKNNPGIICMRLDLSYDSSVMSLTNVTDKGVFGSTIHGNDYSTYPYVLCWANDTASANYTVNDVIAVLTFEVSKDAAAGSYPVEISYDYDNYDIFNYDFAPVKFAVSNGGITLSRGDSGDAAENSLSLGKHTTDDKTVSFIATLTSADTISGKVIAAMYDAEKNLLTSRIYDAAAEVDISLDNLGGSKIYVYWWRDLENITPVCHSAELALD